MKMEFLDYIEDIIGAMDSATKFVEGMDYSGFVKDDKTISAAIRKVEIIGEAVKKIPNEVRKDYPQIPWKDMAGMSDKLIHEYFGVDLKRIWNTLKKDIPNLQPIFDKILKDFEG